MLGILILLFCIVPLIELWLLFVVAHQTSALFTLLLVIGTGVLGASLARWQGFQVLRRIENELSAQRLPTTSVVDAAMILVAGLLLLTPGILTDLVGFSLLVPQIRGIYRHWLVNYLKRRVRVQTLDFGFQNQTPKDTIIDVQVIEPNGTERSSDD